MKIMQEKNKEVIPVFYAVDDKYVPFLAVSINSLKENADKNRNYVIYVLTTHVGKDMQEKILEYAEDNFQIFFVDITAELKEVENSLQLRDYYSGATYYRIFIAKLFPQYDRALYLDSDTVILGDVSELFDMDLGSNLIGAIPDGAVAAVPEFRLYTKQTLGIEAERYFNAGVILMDLKKFREEDFYGKFCNLLKTYKFCVAQDQDYLNVICKDRVTLIGMEWNRMPIDGDMEEKPKLIHYNLTMKPWHYEDILFKEYFWEYAKRTQFYDVIVGELANYSQENKQKDAEAERGLIALALREAEREDNYYKTYGAN